MIEPTMYKVSRRASVRWAADELTARGLPVSMTKVRRCTRLLWPSVRLIGSQGERRYTDDDLARLEIVVVLLGLGCSTKEVEAWSREPGTEWSRELLVQRMKVVRRFLTRAGILLESLKGTAPSVESSEALTEPALLSDTTEGQPAIPSDGPGQAPQP